MENSAHFVSKIELLSTNFEREATLKASALLMVICLTHIRFYDLYIHDNRFDWLGLVYAFVYPIIVACG